MKTSSKVHELYMTILPFGKKVLFILLSSIIISLSSWFLTIAWIKFRVRAGKLVQQKNGYDNRVWFESKQTN